MKKYGQSYLTAGLFCALLLLLTGIASQLPAPPAQQPPPRTTAVSYTTFAREIKTGSIRAVTIQGNEITAELTRSLRGQTCPPVQAISTTDTSFTATGLANQIDPTCTIYLVIPPQSDGTLLPLLLHAGVTIKTVPVPFGFLPAFRLFCVLGMVMALLILLGNALYQSKHTSSPAERHSHFLHSHARQINAPERAQTPSTEIMPTRTDSSTSTTRDRSAARVTFADVAGLDEARAELAEVVQFLHQPEQFQRLGAHIPGGILLVGPPGTGKTLLARAVAGEAEVAFFQMSASEFVEMFVGVGAGRVRDLFQRARQAAPCVIFIDEIDAVGRKRGPGLLDSGERDQTLNQLLVELDGFEKRRTVVVMAATNRADMLDPALLRPGRFDRHILIPLPDRRGREAILRIHTRHTPLDATVCLDKLARASTGMSGAELANLVNEAALSAARHNAPALTPEHFAEALTRMQLGIRRSLVLSDDEKRLAAFHECGHALVALSLPEADPVDFITLIPHGQHLGATQFSSPDDRYTLSRAALMARIAVGLGGRVAVKLVFGTDGITTRAEDDLRRVTDLARRMVTRWGMSTRGGLLFLHEDPLSAGASPSNRQSASTALLARPSARSSASSPFMASIIDAEIRRLIEEGRQTAYQILSTHSTQLTRLAEALLEHERLDRQECLTILENHKG